jgi:hypothetical protein
VLKLVYLYIEHILMFLVHNSVLEEFAWFPRHVSRLQLRLSLADRWIDGESEPSA